MLMPRNLLVLAIYRFNNHRKPWYTYNTEDIYSFK